MTPKQKAEEILRESIWEFDLIHTGDEIVFRKACVIRAINKALDTTLKPNKEIEKP